MQQIIYCISNTNILRIYIGTDIVKENRVYLMLYTYKTDFSDSK